MMNRRKFFPLISAFALAPVVAMAGTRIPSNNVQRLMINGDSFLVVEGTELERLRKYALSLTPTDYTRKVIAIDTAGVALIQAYSMLGGPEMERFSKTYDHRDLPSKEVQDRIRKYSYHLRFRKTVGNVSSQYTVNPLVYFPKDFLSQGVAPKEAFEAIARVMGV